MKRVLSTALLAFLAVSLSAAEKGPEIKVVDDRVSIQAQSIPIGQLLRLLDQATGMRSKVPPELANRSISVQFSGLSFDAAVKKIFEGQPLDYVVIDGLGIIVMASSQSGPSEAAPPPVASAPAFQPLPEQPFVIEQEAPPFVPPQQPVPVAPVGGNAPGLFPGAGSNNQPAMIQTPFGPIPNPRANQPQTNPPFPAPAQQNQFGAVPPFGANPPFQNQNNLFGNTSPPMMNSAPAPFPAGSPDQPRRQ